MAHNLLLCDCPGLVFPAVDMPKQLQILCGVYPIAQVRETYSSIQFIAERVPLEDIYHLKLPEDETEWSAWLITAQYALMRGYLTRGGRPDTHRAGIEILHDHLDGKVVLYFLPGKDDTAMLMDIQDNTLEEVNNVYDKILTENSFSSDYESFDSCDEY